MTSDNNPSKCLHLQELRPSSIYRQRSKHNNNNNNNNNPPTPLSIFLIHCPPSFHCYEEQHCFKWDKRPADIHEAHGGVGGCILCWILSTALLSCCAFPKRFSSRMSFSSLLVLVNNQHTCDPSLCIPKQHKAPRSNLLWCLAPCVNVTYKPAANTKCLTCCLCTRIYFLHFFLMNLFYCTTNEFTSISVWVAQMYLHERLQAV